MKTLVNENDRKEILNRLRQVSPDSQRRWGKMSAHQMICHLNDSFKSVIGERQVGVRQTNAVARTLIRWIALYAPLRWPRGVPTMAENDQERGGTPPEEFKDDLDALGEMIQRISSPNRDFQWQRHPLFDEMSDRDWMRWAYLHVDHHLSQFGV